MSIRLFDVRWHSKHAGPSLADDNERVELFLAGCKIAAEGHPCPDCFNPSLWNVPSRCPDLDPGFVAEHIQKYAKVPYISIVGGEPFDQLTELISLCTHLKGRGFHIIVFTHYRMNEDMPIEADELFPVIDVLIDGPYVKKQRIYDPEQKDGFHNVIGSSNQVVWDCYRQIGYAAKHLTGIQMSNEPGIVFQTKENAVLLHMSAEETNNV